MGKLVDGVWRDVWYDTKSTGGRFVRTNASFRNWITPDGKNAPSGKAFEAEAGRYHLYVSYACPWAHRTLIFRKLKGLEDMISVSVVNHFMGSQGWTFHEGDGVIPDPILDAEFLHEIYTAADYTFTGRVTVPVLWDKKTKTIVSNESSEIIRMFNSAFDHLGATPGDFHPEAQRAEIDEVNERVYLTVRYARLARGAAFEAAIPGRRPDHRGRLAPLHDPGAVRRGVRRPLQDQPEADRGLPESMGVHARALPSARREEHREHAPHQAPLLREPREHQSNPDRAVGPRHRLRRAARP